MGTKYRDWKPRSAKAPKNLEELKSLIKSSRPDLTLDKFGYGDYGLEEAYTSISEALKSNKRIALYADYDVDGTTSCISWIWFFQAIGYTNYTYYIPDRFSEGYGVHLAAVKKLIAEGSQVIITMDTGITANAEAAYCKSQGVEFICTDHHEIQKNKMPDCIVLNPKNHPNKDYQQLSGCGITFFLLEKLGADFSISKEIRSDLLALTGMSTICDVVDLTKVNHRIAKKGIAAIKRSRRPIFAEFFKIANKNTFTEQDLGFKIGPLINAIGRLEHAHTIIEAFTSPDPIEYVETMIRTNNKRKSLQEEILEEARAEARKYPNDSILFLGGDWHQGIIGIVASRLAEEFWRPVYLFSRGEICKGSARSIPNFSVIEALSSIENLLLKFGGHTAASGYSFNPANEDKIRDRLNSFANQKREQSTDTWNSYIEFDAIIPSDLLNIDLVNTIDSLRPFGHKYPDPRFVIKGKIDSIKILNKKELEKDIWSNKPPTPLHTKLVVSGSEVMLFNTIIPNIEEGLEIELLVSAHRNIFRGNESLSLFADDYQLK